MIYFMLGKEPALAQEEMYSYLKLSLQKFRSNLCNSFLTQSTVGVNASKRYT